MLVFCENFFTASNRMDVTAGNLQLHVRCLDERCIDLTHPIRSLRITTVNFSCWHQVEIEWKSFHFYSLHALTSLNCTVSTLSFYVLGQFHVCFFLVAVAVWLLCLSAVFPSRGFCQVLMVWSAGEGEDDFYEASICLHMHLGPAGEIGNNASGF